MLVVLTTQSVNVLYDMLNLTESVEKLLPRFQDVLTENVLFSIHV